VNITVIAQDQKSTQDGDINEERAIRVFIAQSDIATDPVAVSNAGGVPDYYDAHPGDSTYLMKQKQTKSLGEEAGRFKWEIQCQYSNRIVRPLDMIAKIEWDFSEASESYFYDKTDAGTPCPCGTTAGDNGCPVVNSAGQPFDSIPTRETGSITATITKNVAADFDISLFLIFRECINEAGFTVDGVSLDAKQAKVSGANVSDVQLSAGDHYRVVKLVLKFKQSWDDAFADMGYYEKDGSGGLTEIVRVGILAGSKPEAVKKPWPLNGSGVAQSDSTTAPAKLTYFPYEVTDFSDLSALLS
jgi:hypothetical protein